MGQSYFRTLIGNSTGLPNGTTFNDLLMALDLDFKVAIFFDIEYLRNDTR